MAGTTHFRYYGSSNSAQKWRVDIMDTTYAGSDFATLNPDGNGFGIGWEGAGEDVYIPLIKSTFSASLHRDINSRLLLDLTVQGPEARFIVIIFKLVSGTYTRQWQGFLLQDSLTKPDAADNTDYIQITATDGFGLLEDLEYTGYDINSIDRFTCLEWITLIGAKMPLDYVASSDPLFEFASIWYEDSQQSSIVPTPEAADPLANTLISESAFLKVDEYGVVVANSYGEILKAILSVFNLQISQWNGRYLIIQQNTYAQAQTRSWYYDKTGAFVSTQLINLHASMPDRFTDGEFNFQLPTKVITTEYEYRQGIYSNNLFPYNVDDGVTYQLGLSTQNAVLILKGLMENTITSDTASAGPFIAVYKLTIKCGAYYLQNSGNSFIWSLTVGYVYVRDRGADFSTIVGTISNISAFSLTTPPLPTEEEAITFRWDFYQYELFVTHAPLTIPGTNTYSYDDIEGSFVARINTGVIMEGTILHKAHVSNSARSNVELEPVGLGDGQNKYSAGALFVNDVSSAIVDTNVWSIYSEIGVTTFQVNSLRCREMLSLRQSTVQTYAGYFKNCPDYHKGFSWLGIYWAWQSIEWNMREDRYSGTLIGIVLNRTGITVDTPLYKQDDSNTGSNSGSSNSGTTNVITSNYWQRTGTELSPITAGDNVNTSGLVQSINATGESYSTLNNGDVTQRKESTISNQASYNSASELTSGTNIFNRFIAFSKSSTVYNQFKEIINAAENWTTGSRAIEWIIQTVMTGSTSLATRLTINKDGQFIIGNGGNHTLIQPDGTIFQEGSATTFEDIIPEQKKTATAPPSMVTMTGGISIDSFSGTAMNEIFFTIQLPRSYKEGSGIVPRVNWMPMTSPLTTKNVLWKLEYQWQNTAGVYSGSTNTTVSVTAATGTVGFTFIESAFSAITGPSQLLGSVLVCRLYRDATDAIDDYTGGAGLLNFCVKFEKNKLGSDS